MQTDSRRARIVIMGAAGRDFHNFNVVFRDDPAHEVVAFTAAQIPGIAGRRYPPALSGVLYPDGIPIVEEAEIDSWLGSRRVEKVVFAYSDITHVEVMHRASRALAAGADFILLGPGRTMLRANRPVIAISAVRTGCGKSQTARWVAARLRLRGLRVGVVRHPMPYGDLERQAAQRFASREDLDAAACTIEEREEYEPHIEAGNVVYAGVDYARVIQRAEPACDVILWDGGNNDFPFLHPDLHVVLIDPMRPGHETTHHPGEAVLRMADVVVVAKADAAAAGDVERVAASARRLNPLAAVVPGASPVVLEDQSAVRGRRVLVIEDGPTITHGGMPHGAGYAAAMKAGAVVIDPRPFAAPPLAAAFAQYPHIGPVMPALGYTKEQLSALARTIDAAPVDAVLSATPIDIGALLRTSKRVVRVRYEFADLERPGLGGIVDEFVDRMGLARRT